LTTQVLQEHPGAVTFRGEAKTLVGPELHVGDQLPAFTVFDASLKPVTPLTLTNGGKEGALLIIVPSLDTNVCSLESKTFNGRIGELGGLSVYVVSRDLPFAQTRWAKEQGDMKLMMLSDYYDHSFGRNTGLEIKELGLLARAILVIGGDGRVKYRQLVREVAEEPEYDEAIAAAKAVA
jgi:thiol peroxidase